MVLRVPGDVAAEESGVGASRSPTRVTTSPTWSPASSAGEELRRASGRPRPPPRGSVFVSPYVTNKVKYRSPPTSTCDNGPARITSARCRIGFDPYARDVMGGNGFVRIHPGDLHVAAGRDRLDAVLRLATLRRPELRPEADEVLLDLESEASRDQRWPNSWIGITTSRIRARNPTIASGPPTWRASMISAVRRRAQMSARSMCTTETTEGGSCSSTMV